METDKQAAINIRLGRELRDKVQAAARLNCRSIAGEVRMLLALTYDPPQRTRLPHEEEK
jgi:hypothetical protein